MSSAMGAFGELSQCTPPSQNTEDVGCLSPCAPIAGFDEAPRAPDAVRMAPRTVDFDAVPRTPESLVMSPCTPCAVVPDLAPGRDASMVRRRITKKSKPSAAYLEEPGVGSNIWGTALDIRG